MHFKDGVTDTGFCLDDQIKYEAVVFSKDNRQHRTVTPETREGNRNRAWKSELRRQKLKFRKAKISRVCQAEYLKG